MKFYLTKTSTGVLKFASAILIVVHHYLSMVFENSDHIFLKLIIFFGGATGVAVFFFLSGYGLMESERRCHTGLWDFFNRRFLKIYMPVLLVTALWLGLMAAFPLEKPLYFSNLSFTYNLFVGFADPVLWFVQVLWCLYAGFYLFSVIFRHNRFAGIVFLTIFTVVATVATYHFQSPYFAMSVPLFTVGVVLSLVRDKEYIILLIIDLLAIILAAEMPFYDVYCSIRITFNLAVIMTIVVVFSVRRIELRMPAALAAMSFDVYLVHFKPLMMCRFGTGIEDICLYTAITISGTLLFFYIRKWLLGPKTSNYLSKLPDFWRKRGVMLNRVNNAIFLVQKLCCKT